MPRLNPSLSVVLFTLLSVSLSAAQASPSAAVPNLINFSGTLPAAGGGAIPATTGVTFAIYKQQSEGAPLWIETQNVTPDSSGRYTVLLGSTKPEGVPAELFSEHEERWLGVQQQGQGEQPRVLLVSVPYAMKAAEADKLEGHNASEFVTTDKLQAAVQQQMEQQGLATPSTSSIAGARTSNGKNAPVTTNPATNFTDTTTNQVVLVTQNGTGAGLRAMATTGTAVQGISSNIAVSGTSTGTSSSSIGIYGTSKGIGIKGGSTDTMGSSAGIQGTSSAPTGYAVYGSETATTGLNYGVYGTTASNGGIGLRGVASATTGNTIGLLGTSASNTGIGIKAIVQGQGATALLLQNATTGGVLINAVTSTGPKFKVDGFGSVTAEGSITALGATFSGNTFTNNIYANNLVSGNVSASSTYMIGGVTVLSVGSLTDKNVFLGAEAGSSNFAGFGQQNVFSGYQAGHQNTRGSENAFTGAYAGNLNTTGSDNVFTGVLAGYRNTTGAANVFDGYESGYGNTTGINNVSIGTGAGAHNATSDSNTYVGAYAGYFSVGDNNVFIGYSAGYGGGSSDIYIGHGGESPGAANEIRIGTQGTGVGQQNAAYIAGIYGNAPSGALPVVINASGQLGTTTAGIGVTSFNGRSGAVVPATGDYNFAQIGGALASGQLSGVYDSVVSLSNPSNIYYGNGANLTGVVAGPGSPYYIQNGTSQQASANFNISGTGTANSFNAGTTYQIGGSPVLSVGNSGNSLFVGVAAGQNNTAAFNTFLGGGSGTGNTSGSSNTFSGFFSGVNNTTGSFNTFLGYLAGFDNATGNDNVYIVNSGPDSGTESNTIRIGTQGTGNFQQNTTYIAGIASSTVTGVAVNVDPSTGQLGVASSSRRFKEQIRDMGESSSALMKLRPVSFYYKAEYDKGARTLQYGLIAEEVADIYPDLVAYEPDGKPYTVKYQYLTTMLLNEMQKQYHRAEAEAVVITQQEDRLGAQQEQIKSLQRQNEEFQQRLLRLEGLMGNQETTTAGETAHGLQ